jgi:hypothetical protein
VFQIIFYQFKAVCEVLYLSQRVAIVEERGMLPRTFFGIELTSSLVEEELK